MEIIRKLFLLGALFINLIPVDSHARKSLNLEERFRTKIQSPSIARFCGNALWVYSVSDHSLTAIHPKSGETLASQLLNDLTLSGDVHALACREKQLILAQSDGLYAFHLNQHSLQPSTPKFKFNLPEKGLTRDLSCLGTQCWLIQNEIYTTKNLEQWNKLSVPASASHTAAAVPEGENPFSNWIDQFIISKGQYSRVRPHGKNQISLLDPLRSHVVHENKRWGNWGVWEGRFMYPKGFTAVEQNSFAISDTGTHVILFFDNSGKYQGTLGNVNDWIRFQYPIDLEFFENTLVVVDFKANEIIAYKTDTKKIIDFPADLTRSNLLRHPTALKNSNVNQCLFCHDGYFIQNLGQFVSGKSHHPLKILEDGKVMNCASCHHPHHVARSGKIVDFHGKTTSVSKAPGMLKKDATELCLSCHVNQGDRSKNHFHLSSQSTGIQKAGGIQVQACSQCHSAHGGHEKLLHTSPPGLCVGCHSTQKIPQNHVLNDKVNCTSCHALHGSKKEFSFSKHDNGKACLSCHKEIETNLKTSTHLTKISKKHSWIASENTCIECHNPHKPGQTEPALCLNCHQDRNHSHQALVRLQPTERAQGIHLKSESISCTTCHDPHGTTKTREPKPVIEFCASCHGSRSPDFFKDYHSRFSAKNKRAHP